MLWGERGFSFINTWCCCCHRRLLGSQISGGKKIFFLKEKEKEGENVSWRLWRALQIGTALSTAFHGFLESIQRRISFVRDGLSFLLRVYENCFLVFQTLKASTLIVYVLRMYLLASVTCCGSQRRLFGFSSLCSPSFPFIPAALEIARCVAQGSYQFPLAIK